MYRPNKTNDYRFFDRTISEQFTVGGLDIYIHKYLGPKTVENDPTTTGVNGDATQPNYQVNDPLFVQDLLLGEIRDRAYDPDIYVMRGVYRQQDIDFGIGSFGLYRYFEVEHKITRKIVPIEVNPALYNKGVKIAGDAFLKKCWDDFYSNAQ